jgi:hypothetical protein
MTNLIEILKNGGEVPKGTLDKLIVSGVFPLSTKTHYNIYNTYCQHYKQQLDNGNKNAQTTAITLAADSFSVSEMTVYRSIRKMESLTIIC